MSDQSNAAQSITRHQLYELVWAEPMTKIAPRFGLSDVGLAKVCKRFEIPRPPVGYWAQKEVGKAPDQTPLPPADDEAAQTITFTMEEKAKATPALAASDLVADEHLKKLIAFEELAENHLAVTENPSRFHPFVRAAKASFSDRYNDRQGLSSPSWSADGPRLDIHVTKNSIPRALRFMDALIKAFENRGHRVVAAAKENRNEVMFVILGEEFRFRLREKTKMVPVPESERKRDHFANRVTYEPTGNLELQLWRKQWGNAEATWKDGKKAKLEDQLNAIMIELVVAVEKERIWRRQREEDEKSRRAEEAKRWEREQERRREEDKIKKLEVMVQNWDRAARIRAFMLDVKTAAIHQKGPVEEGSDLAQWIAWALRYADMIDPLGSHGRSQAATTGATAPASGDWARPNQPR